MGKFRRVAETQELPEIIEQALMPTKEDDMFANLRAGTTKRNMKIAKETMGYEEEVPKDNSWERVTTASIYSTPRLAPTDGDMSNLRPEDASNSSVRRAGYDVDNGINVRDFKWCTTTDAMNILHGNSIFSPEYDEISDMMVEENRQRDAQFESAQKRVSSLAANHKQWEEEQMAALCPKKVISSRAHAILRTSTENVSASRFGIQDIDAIERHEEERARMTEARLAQTKGISRKGASYEEKRSQWEGSIDLKANRMQDTQSSWLDGFLDD